MIPSREIAAHEFEQKWLGLGEHLARRIPKGEIKLPIDTPTA
jgi:hypothetical protein